MPTVRTNRLCTLLVLVSLLLAVTGCATSGGSLAAGGSTTLIGGAAPGSPKVTGLGGRVYGAQVPITNATVTLWAAGTTGYGTGATSIATTTSDPVTGASASTLLPESRLALPGIFCTSHQPAEIPEAGPTTSMPR